MTNREYYDMMCDKSNKYDIIKKALYDVRSEIIEHRRKTGSIDRYDLVGDCLDIVNKHILEVEESEENK